MSFLNDIGQMLAGIAILLLGMNFMEESVNALARRNFKLFLKRQTSNRLKAIIGGTLLSGLLQSSSIVNLLILSLVGAGVIQMQNALAILLGSNLGSTITSWLMAVLGFNFDINSFAFPLAGVAGLIVAFNSNQTRVYQWGRLFLGFSFLFMGLGFIKGSMINLVQHADLSILQQYPPIIFLLAGIIITGIVQSSSATIAIVLSLLYVNAISLHNSMAIVLGSEVGTGFKLFVAWVKGNPIKKRVAVGNFIFNFGTMIIVFPFLQSFHYLISNIFQINNNLIALVVFQSLINLISIILFAPFLSNLNQFLSKRFSTGAEQSLYINKAVLNDPELSLDAFERESRSFIYQVLEFFMTAAHLKFESFLPGQSTSTDKPIMEKYDQLKELHGEIHGYYLSMQRMERKKEETERGEQLIASTRNCMYAAKSIKDVIYDIEQLYNSSNDIKYNYYLQVQQKIARFSARVQELMGNAEAGNSHQLLLSLYKETQDGYSISLRELYKQGLEKRLNESEISTLVNVNREAYTAFKSIIFSVKDIMLPPAEADQFDELPGFIR